ncbi:hypothetical protein D3C71_1168640 [compost metagenome]
MEFRKSMRPKTERELRQDALMKRLRERGNVIPAICLLESDPTEQRFAIREMTLDAKGVVVDVSGHTLSPKAGSSEALRHLIAQLIAQTELGEVSCGEPPRKVRKEELEEWHLLIGSPVFRYRVK